MGFGKARVRDAESGGTDVVHDRSVPEGGDRKERGVRLALDDIDVLSIVALEAGYVSDVAVRRIVGWGEECDAIPLHVHEITHNVIEADSGSVDVEVAWDPRQTKEDGECGRAGDDRAAYLQLVEEIGRIQLWTKRPR